MAEFDEKNRELTRLNRFVGKLSALLNPVTYLLINLATVWLIRVAGVRVNLGGLGQGEVVALYNYMLQIIVELIKLAALIITLNKSLACARRASAVLAVEPGLREPETSQSTAEGAPAVAFSHVSFIYPGAGAPSLTDIDFCAEKGQIIGIIGGTGSGKTTLCDLIPRFYEASEGEVRLFGAPVNRLSRRRLGELCGVVPQKAVLFRGSVRDNLLWGKENASDEELWRALRLAQAEEVVRQKPGGLDFELEQNGRNLSGGQKQRLTIARALVKNPPILILELMKNCAVYRGIFESQFPEGEEEK